MSIEEKATENLFTYGTLQTESVQLATFGRKLVGTPDGLVGYSLAMIQIEDQEFVALSGAAHHRNLHFTGNTSDIVNGIVFKVTGNELEQSDAYEPAEYKRVRVELQSGMDAWVYLNIPQ